MKHSDEEGPLKRMDLPRTDKVGHQQELKIPLLSYKRSSRAGLWLLAVPFIFAVTAILKYYWGVSLPASDLLVDFFDYVSGNQFLTILIPIIFVGLPLLVMTINFLAICHFASVREKRELLVTIKYRPVNIAMFLFSFVILVYFVLPDNLP